MNESTSEFFKWRKNISKSLTAHRIKPRMNPVGEKTAWEENTPDSLVDICTRDDKFQDVLS